MKESDITQPVIDKCKQIAKLWRMEIYEGCWVKINRKARLVEAVLGHYYFTQNGQWNKSRGIPIPSISDCLEKLRELKWCIETSWIMEPRVRLDYVQPKEENKTIKTTGDTLHEALLSALLEVLKND